jgi:hypothetical protein
MIVDALLRRLRDDVTGGWAAAEAAAGAGRPGCDWLAPGSGHMDLCTLPLRWPFFVQADHQNKTIR